MNRETEIRSTRGARDRRPPLRDEAGFALIDALVAAALLAFLLLATLPLAARAQEWLAAAHRLELAESRLDGLVARLDTVSFHRLSEFFGADIDAPAATLDSESGTLPAEWEALLLGLPRGHLRVELHGLGRDGAAAPFRDALALRLDARTSWNERAARRVAARQWVRF